MSDTTSSFNKLLITRPEEVPSAPPTQAPERGAALGLLSLAASILFYCSPTALRQTSLYQFLPQLFAYAAFIAWSALNGSIVQRVGLTATRFPQGLRWGVATGLFLGTINVLFILYLVPLLGGDYRFLADTPHAKVPLWVMVPWLSFFIAATVEMNFRGFFLGRLLAMGLWTPAAVVVSALLFAFDPFLVATFQQLHWIALWDGLVWGALWVTMRNLYATIVAHAVEVILLYLVIRAVLN